MWFLPKCSGYVYPMQCSGYVYYADEDDQMTGQSGYVDIPADSFVPPEPEENWDDASEYLPAWVSE